MATIREVVLPNQKKEDGTWNVKIRIIHERKVAYISTKHFVGPNQLRKDSTIKDPFILDLINPDLKTYRFMISDLGARLSFYDAKALAHYLENGGLKKAEEINVIEFGRNRIDKLKQEGRISSAMDMAKVVYSLIDFCKTDKIPITLIRAKFLEEYEDYLRNPRTLERPGNSVRMVTRKVAGVSRTGLHNHMRDLRILFNAVKDYYNDKDMGVEIVKHYPFEKYKVGKPAKNVKPKLTIEQIRKVKDCEVPCNTRTEQARDLAMLSFYLCGMNAADLYRLPVPDNAGHKRINYNRKKTMSRRDDEAFMSVKIPEIARPLYEKYAGKLQEKYSTAHALDQALSKGMASLRKIVNIPDLDFYDFRHGFADIARNTLMYDKDNIAEALNHVNPENSVTDIYLARSWDIIDRIQGDVINLLVKIRITKR